MNRIIFHVDVNNAFLSWTAVYKLEHGEEKDIRKEISAIGGDEKSRHGVVLAKSPQAKKIGIKTGTSLYEARKICKNLKVYPPNYEWYTKESNKMYKYLCTITPVIERYSIDECFLDLTGTNYLYDDYIKLAYKIKNDIKEKFGFTVNVGIGENKLCAKMASDMEGPDKVHTLYKNEIKEKMWPMQIENLFMVGKKTSAKLRKIGITTIGELAQIDPKRLEAYFKNNTKFLIDSANGIDESKVERRKASKESISISETLTKDINDSDKLKEILFKQTEALSRDLREKKKKTTGVCITYKNKNFVSSSHGEKITAPKNSTIELYKDVMRIFEKSYNGDDIRNIGIRFYDLTDEREKQISLFDKEEDKEKEDNLDVLVDSINKKFGNVSVVPASIKIIGESTRHRKERE